METAAGSPVTLAPTSHGYVLRGARCLRGALSVPRQQGRAPHSQRSSPSGRTTERRLRARLAEHRARAAEIGKKPSPNFLFGFPSPVVSKDQICLEAGECKMLQFQAVFSIVYPILKTKETCFLTGEHFDWKSTVISVL